MTSFGSKFLTMISPKNPLVISFLSLRRSVGILGIAFPFVLVIGSILIGNLSELQGSISSYYHTVMRNVFVGVLCAVGLFLFSYKGYDKMDNVAGVLGCLFALGVAFFPCNKDPQVFGVNPLIGNIHLISASLFFLDLSFYSLVLFTKSNEPKSAWKTPKKRRNRVYITCGVVMLSALLLIVLSMTIFKHSDFIQNLKPVFWLETIALVAFGISWITKGQVILKDKV